MNKLARIKFYLVPKAYFIKNDYYYVILELKVFYKSNSQFFFTAENMLVKFQMAKSYDSYNLNPSEIDNVLDVETMVQFFISPKKTTDTTDESMTSEVNQFKLSELKLLVDYNLFKSKLFDFDE